eukprot:gene18897-25455_t
MSTSTILSKACMLCLCVLFSAPSISAFEPPPRRPTVEESLKDFTCPPRDDSNVVLTAAFAMRPLQLCPFRRSIERHSPGTFVVIFIEDGDVPEWRLQKGGNIVTARVPAGVNTGDHWYGEWRWIAFHAYLESCGYLGPDSQKSGMMAIIDGRDSIFQDDLWKNPMMLKAQETNSVILTLEGNPERIGESWIPVNRTIRTEKYNRNWVEVCFQYTKFPDKSGITMEDILDSPISCAGTTMGSSTAVSSYVTSMVDELFNCPMDCWIQHGDQGVHNYLVAVAIKESDKGGEQLPWRGLVLEAGIAPAYNCALGTHLHLTLEDRHRYYLDLGSHEFMPPVVHQYDRIGGQHAMMNQFSCYFKI